MFQHKSGTYRPLYLNHPALDKVTKEIREALPILSTSDNLENRRAALRTAGEAIKGFMSDPSTDPELQRQASCSHDMLVVLGKSTTVFSKQAPAVVDVIRSTTCLLLTEFLRSADTLAKR